MSGALQAVFQNLRSFKEPAPTVIGQAFGGGYYAGQISTAGNGIADYYLIVAPKASGQSIAKWANGNTNISGAVSPTNGPQNTTDMYVTGDSPAANYVKGLSIGGYTDWYIPARYELEILYYNLKPTTRVNSTDYGNNPYAVPPHGNYTTGNPAQTSASSFQNTNSEAFDVDTTPNSYWASNQWPPNPTIGAWDTFFGSGVAPNNNGKQSSNFVRAIRRVAV